MGPFAGTSFNPSCCWVAVKIVGPDGSAAVEAASGNDIESLWAQDPEWIVERLIERLQGLADEVDEEEGRED